jgi:hypothetical protein
MKPRLVTKAVIADLVSGFGNLFYRFVIFSLSKISERAARTRPDKTAEFPNLRRRAFSYTTICCRDLN